MGKKEANSLADQRPKQINSSSQKYTKHHGLSWLFPVNLGLGKTSRNAFGGGSGCLWKIKISWENCKELRQGLLPHTSGWFLGGNFNFFLEGEGRKRKGEKGREAWHCPHVRAGKILRARSQIFALKANKGPGEEKPAPEGTAESPSLISSIPILDFLHPHP